MRDRKVLEDVLSDMDTELSLSVIGEILLDVRDLLQAREDRIARLEKMAEERRGLQ